MGCIIILLAVAARANVSTGELAIGHRRSQWANRSPVSGVPVPEVRRHACACACHCSVQCRSFNSTDRTNERGPRPAHEDKGIANIITPSPRRQRRLRHFRVWHCAYIDPARRNGLPPTHAQWMWGWDGVRDRQMTPRNVSGSGPKTNGRRS